MRNGMRRRGRNRDRYDTARTEEERIKGINNEPVEEEPTMQDRMIEKAMEYNQYIKDTDKDREPYDMDELIGIDEYDIPGIIDDIDERLFFWENGTARPRGRGKSKVVASDKDGDGSVDTIKSIHGIGGGRIARKSSGDHTRNSLKSKISSFLDMADDEFIKL